MEGKGKSNKQLYKYNEDEDALREFFTSHYDQGAVTPKYMDQLKEIKSRKRAVFDLELEDIAFSKIPHERIYQLAERIQSNPVSYVHHICNVIDMLLEEIDVPAPPVTDTIDFLVKRARERMQMQGADATSNLPPSLARRYEVNLVVKPHTDDMLQVRDLRASTVGKLTTVTGMCISLTPMKPKIVLATYLCESCNDCVYQEVIGSRYTPLQQCPSQQCKANATRGRLFFESRASKFVKYQELRLQELPQYVPKGCVPRSVKVICEGSSACVASPGCVVQITGVLLPEPKHGRGAFRASVATQTCYVAYNIKLAKKGYEQILKEDSTEQIATVRSSTDEETFNAKLIRSIAPEIFGMEDIKKVLCCQLVGGVNLERKDGMRLRGDINVCLMGDPGVAKSQLLKWIAHLCPRSVFTTGKGSSGVGLTAAVVIDEHTKESVLEGGALVLSDRGVCCIDEFDKMDESDRTSIHEVMEQQTISIAKGGIITTLNARTSILAAANPQFGRWRHKSSPTENINLPPSLLSRFDVLWLLLDRPDRERDAELARHVTRVHQAEGLSAGGEARTRAGFGLSNEDPYFPKDFIRAYIAEAKKREPFLDPSVMPMVLDLYVGMRNEGQGPDATTYTTPRTLLSILRMSQALARLRLADTVTEADVKEAARLMRASKESILLPTLERYRRQDPIPAIYEMLKDEQSRAPSVLVMDLAPLRKKLAMARYTDEQLESCLVQYEKVAVFLVNRDSKGNALSIQWL